VEIKFTQEFILHVAGDWYDEALLCSEGTRNEQIVSFEKSRAQMDPIYLMNLKRGALTVEIVKEDKEDTTLDRIYAQLESARCLYCLSKKCLGNCEEYMAAKINESRLHL
jgi:hypothetical protein